MRTGRAAVSLRKPRAHAICDRCGFRYNHDQLAWQFQWQGPKLQNIRLLVCRTCMDVPQVQLRTIILPPDPVPIENPRPEAYIPDSNPNSPIGQSINPVAPGSNVGSLIGGGGTFAAFDGSINKPFFKSANLAVSDPGMGNWVGKNWAADPTTGQVPSDIASDAMSFTALSFTAYAPSDAPFLGSGSTTYAFQGSSDGSTWTTLASNTTAGTNGEVLAVSLAGATAFQFHRLIFSGDGITPVGVALLRINTDRGIPIPSVTGTLTPVVVPTHTLLLRDGIAALLLHNGLAVLELGH